MSKKTSEARRVASRLNSGKGIYGRKKNGKFGRLNAQERAEWLIEKGLFDTDDVRKLPKRLLKDFSKALESRDKTLGVSISYDASSPEDLFQRYAEQQNAIDEMEIADKQRNPEKYGLEKPPEYNEWKQVASDDDKWTILRRLAQIDGRLNIDRAYASATLHDIENIIEQNEFNIDEITEQMSERLNDIEAKVQKWNEALQDFADDEEDALLVQNRGFHGVSKARSHDEATKAGRTRNRGQSKQGHWLTDEQYEAFLEWQRKQNT